MEVKQQNAFYPIRWKIYLGGLITNMDTLRMPLLYTNSEGNGIGLAEPQIRKSIAVPAIPAK